jgi:hypothetical protein
MNVYVVIAEHANGSSVVDIFKNEGDAEEAVADHEQGAEEQHNQVWFYIEEYTVR